MLRCAGTRGSRAAEIRGVMPSRPFSLTSAPTSMSRRNGGATAEGGGDREGSLVGLGAALQQELRFGEIGDDVRLRVLGLVAGGECFEQRHHGPGGSREGGELVAAVGKAGVEERRADLSRAGS